MHDTVMMLPITIMPSRPIDFDGLRIRDGCWQTGGPRQVKQILFQQSN